MRLSPLAYPLAAQAAGRCVSLAPCAGSVHCFTALRPARLAGALLLVLAHWLPLPGLAQGQPSGARPATAPAGKAVELRLAAGTYRLVAGAVAPVAPAEIVEGRYYRLVQFDRLPTDAQRAALTADGRVELLTYLPQNAWVAALKAGTDPAAALRGLPVRAIVTVEPEWKLSSSLASRNYPSHALRAGGRLALRVQPYAPVALATAARRLRALGAAVAETTEHPDVLEVTVAVGEERRLAAEPWVQAVEAAPAPPTLEAERDVTNHRANVLNSNLPNGRHLDGAGVTISIGDDGFVGPHIDFQGRLTNVVTSSDGDHADHVTGIVGGAGNLNPTVRGQATGATLRTYSYYADIAGMTGPSGLYATQSVRISSHSLGQTCNDGYTSDARTSDQHIRQNPALMYVHSSGNSGTINCAYGAGTGWGTITGGHKMGKNVLTIGNLTHLDVLDPSSSRGPAKDGRLKPDICATGTNVNSTGENNTFNVKTGTSMACPAVSGVLGQLYQAYRNANGGADPNSALIKAAVLNTADDIGNAGPDFKHGYGRINALRAVELLENTRYATNTLSTGQTQTVGLTVPPGASQLKVMLYWADYEAAANAATALVNDLDLTLSTPAAGTLQPWVLNPAPNATTLDAPATRGADHLNNMEQVTLDAPATGTYTATISGFGIPQGPQAYYVVYSWVENNVRITYPIGGEAFVPGEAQVLRWDANTTATSFTLEYSTTGGTSWNSIGTAVAAARAFTWTVPASLATTPSGQVRVRVVRDAQISSSENLTVAGIPANLRVESVCPTETRLNWDAVTGATSYEIFKLGTTTMESVGTTAALAFTVTGVALTAEQWFSVRATGAGGLVGRRANALRRVVGLVNCPGVVAPTITSFTPTSGPAGTVVTITGTGLTGATAVSFNGTSAPTFTVVNATTITVTVPAGALSGPITVTTPNGLSTSTQSFNTGSILLNDNLPVTTCSGTLYDSGGPGSDYSNNQNFTKTFSPATAGSMLRLVFTAFNTEATYDFLYIYDGANTSAPLLGRYDGTVGPGTVTATNAAGQLTLRFTSDVSDTRAGFAATIACVLPAPTLTAVAPSPGGLGQRITLTGTNLSSPTALTINGANALANILNNSGNSLVVRVPVTAAASGVVSLTTAAGTATAPFAVMPAPGNALAFDGVDDFVEGTSPALPQGNAARTLTAWVYPTNTNCGLFIYGTNASNQRAGLSLLANRLYYAGSGNDLIGNTELTAGRWHHVAATFDGTTLRLYLNGELDATAAKSFNTTGPNWRMGTTLLTGNTPLEQFAGRLDEVRVYNTALSPAQVRADRASAAAVGGAGLVLHYNFDQGTPATGSTGNNAGQTEVYDLTNAATGTLTNMALASGNTTSNWVQSYALVVPVATTSTARNTTGFTATWAAPAVGTATSYLLDVSTAATFSAPITGSPFAVAAPATSYALTGLSTSSTYFYRVRALNSALAQPDQGAFSNTMGQTTPLPVELTAFTATASGTSAVHLAWATASEKNSNRFEVERSANGSTFDAVGTVAAAGNSTTLRTYELLDAKLPAATPTLYYRLRQVDADGSAAYSPVRVVALKGAAGLALFPNPATTGATLTGATPGALVTVFDALGRTVLAVPTDATGTAVLALPTGLAGGVYVVRSGAYALRLTVQQ